MKTFSDDEKELVKRAKQAFYTAHQELINWHVEKVYKKFPYATYNQVTDRFELLGYIFKYDTDGILYPSIETEGGHCMLGICTLEDLGRFLHDQETAEKFKLKNRFKQWLYNICEYVIR